MSQSSEIEPTSKQAQHYDVLICGGGLVGLSLASALRKTGLTIALLDAQAEPQTVFDSEAAGDISDFEFQSQIAPRVSSLNLASQRFLEQLDAWPLIDQKAPYTELSVIDSRGSAGIAFSAASIGQPNLGHIIENQRVIGALLKTLEGSDVEKIWQTRLSDIAWVDGVYELETEGGELFTANLLVGADGGNSVVRQLCGLKNFSWSYEQQAVVTTIKVSEPHGGVARQWFTEEGPLAFLPLLDPSLCSIVWSSANTDAMLAQTPEVFCRNLTEASEATLGDVLAIDRRFSFPLRQQHALRYHKQGLVLIGDAAHTIHPLAGQGVNLGFADASELARVIKQAILSDELPGNTAGLARYERARQPQNLLMMSVMEAFKRLYDTGDVRVNWVRNMGMKLLDQSELTKGVIARLATGL